MPFQALNFWNSYSAHCTLHTHHLHMSDSHACTFQIQFSTIIYLVYKTRYPFPTKWQLCILWWSYTEFSLSSWKRSSRNTHEKGLDCILCFAKGAPVYIEDSKTQQNVNNNSFPRNGTSWKHKMGGISITVHWGDVSWANAQKLKGTWETFSPLPRTLGICQIHWQFQIITWLLRQFKICGFLAQTFSKMFLAAKLTKIQSTYLSKMPFPHK